MTTQPEQILEDILVEQLVKLGYESVSVHDEATLLQNLKKQLELHNKLELSENDFKQILNFINKGNVFERSKILRDRVPYTNAKGETKSVELIDQVRWCQNRFQVTRQFEIDGKYKNRYDVTILINGLPLVQIELKRRGVELKEAYNQINRYERHSYGAGEGLFHFIQIFVISNGVNSKYYANGPLKARNFKQTFYWTDIQNNHITQLASFTDTFLEPCHLSKMITKYIVLNESQKVLMVLRPYQFYAVEAIEARVRTQVLAENPKNGFIWHTTGSGKTLTSFKTSQILSNIPMVHKVVFVVDRKDLDYQTSVEFNSFSEGSVDGTNNTNALVKQLAGENKLIVTTIQKLNTAITKQRYLSDLEHLRKERVVFIFDECHRSQFGKTHDSIKKFFKNCQMFGFTGTPIFPENAGTNEYGKRTTAMLFDERLHKYVITDAIRDENVLKFSVEYIRTFKKKEHILDIEVEAIDEEEVMNAPQRLSNVVDYIIQNHNRKTHSGEFNSIFCVSSIPALISYYDLFYQKKQAGEHDLKIASIFTYQVNEDDKDTLGFVDEEDEVLSGMAAEPQAQYISLHSREKLDEFISHYNTEFGTNYSTRDSQSFYNYYNDVAKKIKNRQIDVLLVVNMFLTGFDSKHLNTLYVDKNLKHHGLIQAYSRTNRILNELKSQGNIVCFRNLKNATDEAIGMFSTNHDKEDVLIKSYEAYVKLFNQAYISLIQIAPTVNSVEDLISEDDELAFIKAFRELIRLRNVLGTFTEFTFDDLSIKEQIFDDYKSKYLDLYDKARRTNQKERVSILNDIDFEVELIHRDEINVSYILRLIAKLKEASPEDQEKQKKLIIDTISGDVQLRSKRELIEKFIEENLPHIDEVDDVLDAFIDFVDEQRLIALTKICSDEGLDFDKFQTIVGEFLFSQKEPLRDEIIAALKERPSLKERASKSDRIIAKIHEFVDTYINDTDLGV